MFTTYVANRLYRDSKLRLFQQLHQSSTADTEWRRASGKMICSYCGLRYQQHPVEEIVNTDHRLCDGTLIHA
jgi:hypothetical protein